MSARDVASKLGLREKSVASAIQEARSRGEVVEKRRRNRGEARLRDAVWGMFVQGNTPSEIDETLGMNQAREIITTLWSMDWQHQSRRATWRV